MNNQEAFDTVLTKLREQKVRSATPGGACLYRDDRGNKCAAGHLIPDALYDKEMEDTGIDVVIKRFPAVGEVMTGVNRDLLLWLQDAHDQHLKEGLSTWEYSMQAVAKHFDLKYTPREV